MLVPKKNRLEVYKYLFRGARARGSAARARAARARAWRAHAQAALGFPPSRRLTPRAPRAAAAEGVCFAEKDYNLPKHPEMDVPNLHVRRAAPAGARLGVDR